MAKKKSVKSADVVPEYKPSLHLDDKMAKAMANAPVGKKVKVTVEAVVTSQSQHRGYDGQLRRSTGLEVNKVKPQSKPAPKRGKK